MVREIGSFYEKNSDFFIGGGTLEKDDSIEKNEPVKSCLAHGYIDYCMLSCGREGLMMALADISKRADYKRLKCMLPAYTCDTVVQPFEKYGCHNIFYGLCRNLEPDADSFTNMIENEKPDIIVIHAYYGIDTFSKVRPALAAFRAAGGTVIEDLTQSLFMKLDYMADYYVASLRKWSNVTDGGIIISKTELHGKPEMERSDYIDIKNRAMAEKTKYLKNISDDNYEAMQEVKKVFLRLNNASEELLDIDYKPHKMSDVSEKEFSAFDFKKAQDMRAVNARFLSDNIKLLHPVRYTGEESPLYFPVYVDKREDFQSFMRENNIFVPVLWLLYEGIGKVDNQTEYIYEHILGIPCDHRYTEEDMERIVEAADRYMVKNENYK